MTFDIDELDRLHAAATRGPWTAPTECCCLIGGRTKHAKWCGLPHDIDPGVAGNYDLEVGGIIEKADRDFIIALRNAWPAISRELRALRAIAEHLAAVQRERDFQEATSQHDNYTDQARSRQREFESFNKAIAAAKAAREGT